MISIYLQSVIFIPGIKPISVVKRRCVSMTTPKKESQAVLVRYCEYWRTVQIMNGCAKIIRERCMMCQKMYHYIIHIYVHLCGALTPYIIYIHVHLCYALTLCIIHIHIHVHLCCVFVYIIGNNVKNIGNIT